MIQKRALSRLSTLNKWLGLAITFIPTTCYFYGSPKVNMVGIVYSFPGISCSKLLSSYLFFFQSVISFLSHCSLFYSCQGIVWEKRCGTMLRCLGNTFIAAFPNIFNLPKVIVYFSPIIYIYIYINSLANVQNGCRKIY